MLLFDYFAIICTLRTCCLLIPDIIGGETMAALDLGGGSTQITFQLTEEDTKMYPSADQFVVSAGENITLYTHRYTSYSESVSFQNYLYINFIF